jgi:hypothetical protein
MAPLPVTPAAGLVRELAAFTAALSRSGPHAAAAK